MFNAIKSIQMLEEAGFTQAQAQALVRILVEAREEKLATKQDLLDLEKRLSARMGELLAAIVAATGALHRRR